MLARSADDQDMKRTQPGQGFQPGPRCREDRSSPGSWTCVSHVQPSRPRARGPGSGIFSGSRKVVFSPPPAWAGRHQLVSRLPRTILAPACVGPTLPDLHRCYCPTTSGPSRRLSSSRGRRAFQLSRETMKPLTGLGSSGSRESGSCERFHAATRSAYRGSIHWDIRHTSSAQTTGGWGYGMGRIVHSGACWHFAATDTSVSSDGGPHSSASASQPSPAIFSRVRSRIGGS